LLTIVIVLLIEDNANETFFLLYAIQSNCMTNFSSIEYLFLVTPSGNGALSPCEAREREARGRTGLMAEAGFNPASAINPVLPLAREKAIEK